MLLKFNQVLGTASFNEIVDMFMHYFTIYVFGSHLNKKNLTCKFK